MMVVEVKEAMDASSLVKTEEELHIAQTTLSRIRNERNQAMTVLNLVISQLILGVHY